VTALIVALVLVTGLLGGCIARSSTESGRAADGVASSEPAVPTGKSDVVQENALTAAPGGEGTTFGAPSTVEGTQVDSLVITTAGVSLEIKNLDATVSAIRDIATKYDATIANLTMSAGGSSGGVEPLYATAGDVAAPTPGSATVTLKVPASKLAAAEKEIAGLGTVKAQTSSQDDVTQQHVDMAARLKNLQAEEARLRSFFNKAKRVSEMLSIEQELARVRGEIESMQAQITYLERQAARATLTVTLSEPGALVSPAVGGWGFSQAVRDGVRAAAGVITTLITLLIAVSPVLVLALVLWFVIRALVRSQRKHRAAAPAVAPEPDMTADADEEQDRR